METVNRFDSRHRFRLLAASADLCDSPFLYSFSISGYARSCVNARHRDCGSTVAGAAFWTFPGMASNLETAVTAGALDALGLRFVN